MSSPSLVAVTVVGIDRPGIVAAVSKTLYEVGCNLEDATSTILRGHFTMTLIVGAPGEMNAETLEHVLQVVASQMSLLITVRPVHETHQRGPDPTHMISVYGADKPGIVFRVAEVLASTGDNITDMTSRVIESGEEPVYALMLEVALSDAGTTESALAELHDELGLDVTVRPIDTDVL